MRTTPSYNQKVKRKARREALSHAIDLVTARREAAAIVTRKYIRRVRRAKLGSGHAYDVAALADLRPKDIRNWEAFRARSIGERDPEEISVAYLAGPEPANDLNALLALGVRPENIWAFENERAIARQGRAQLEALAVRGVKFIETAIEDFFIGTPRRFDIIYIDACASLPKACRLIVTLFRHSALAPLGVLVTNFSKPDITNDQLLQSHVDAIAAYLYPKDFLDRRKGGTTDGAMAAGFSMIPLPDDLKAGEDGNDPLFADEVRGKFAHYYGSFVTRHIIDIAALLAPMARLAASSLWKQLAACNFAEAAERGRAMLRWGEGWDEDEAASDSDALAPMGGEAISDMANHSLLWAFAVCGAYGALDEFDPPEGLADFRNDWMRSLFGMPQSKITGADLAAAYYGLRADPALQSEALRRVIDYPYQRNMAFLCDVPSSEIGFYPAFAQFGHAAHCNVREARRFRYTAKTTEMYLDVLPFDECRYVYDWLSAPALVPGDWSNPSAQLTFRLALDGIAKATRHYNSDFLYGCHVIGIDQNFPADELGRRRNLSRKPRKTKKRPVKGRGK